MQEIRTQHPVMEQLAAFCLGRMSDADSTVIEVHLADCAACRRLLEDVPDDALVCLLQASAAEVPASAAATYGTQAGSSADTDCPSPSAGAAAPGCAVPRELREHARYRVLAPLGAGGMGTVYKARHRLMERVVALKVVSPHLVNKPGAVERFTREVRAAAQLVHPNIVTAHDAEKVGDLHLLVMEYVEGQTLAQVLAGAHELPVAEACEYLRQTALGLQHALDRGMVHRDIKPQNLIVSVVGGPWSVVKDNSAPDPSLTTDPGPRTTNHVVKILDFGLARFLSELAPSDGSTEHGTLMGSPDYMAPEQGEDAHRADTRADIYGMGCTLYHLLAGRVPFPQTSMLGKLEAHRDQQPLPLVQLRPAVPAELANVIAKMMAKDPAQRYQTPAEVADALQPFTQAGRASGRKPDVDAPAARPRRAYALTLAKSRSLLVVAAGLLLVGLGTWAAQVAFRVVTPRGTLIIETDDPDVQIAVKSGGNDVELFFPAQRKRIPLKVGEYTIELVGGKNGLKLSTTRFAITSGNDEKAVTVEFVPAKADADKRAAEYVLSVGGKVRLNDQDREIRTAADLPRPPYRLNVVYFNGNKLVTDAGLKNFAGCMHLTDLGLGNTDAGDVGMFSFEGCTTLTTLAVDGTQVTDVGLGIFKRCKNLRSLFVSYTQVTDAGLAHFKDCKNLSVLTVDHTRVSDAGLAHFKDCKNLYWLCAHDAKVSDAGLAHFKDCKNLRFLELGNTQLTDVGLAHFKDCKDLISLGLAGTAVSDQGLAPFKACKNMNRLKLQKTKVTAAGIAELTKALPRCKIEWDEGVIEPRSK